jgi:hypothetical protein
VDSVDRRSGTRIPEDSRALGATATGGAGPDLGTVDAQKLEKFMTEFRDDFAANSYDCVSIRIYSRFDVGDACPIRLPFHRLPLVSQTYVNVILKTWKTGA